MKYAIIRTGGKQYRVSEGDTIEVDRLNDVKNNKVSFDEVLLLVSDSTVKLGKPTIAGESVVGAFVDNFKDEKIRVSKYKSKVRYRKTIGFRASKTRVKIEKLGNVSASVKTTAKK